ncbi:MAG: DUF1360 domain-containing protein [candidate division NC10 bacterium]|nr:DUF1360 domain-containing protein [candidate division NC10 bacterium]
MNEPGVWLRVVLAVLATWRVTHLLANEDGPADLLVHLRARLGSGLLGKLIDCFQCLSLWVAAPMALFVSQNLVEWLLMWLALSGAACVLERIGQPPVVMEPIPPETKGNVEVNDGMLWSETGGPQGRVRTDNSTGRHATRA